jgi:hypothetical protein
MAVACYLFLLLQVVSLLSLSCIYIYIYIYICIYTCPAESYRLRTEQQAQTIFPKYEFLLLLFMRDQVGGAAGTVDVLSGTSGGGEDGGDGPPDPYKIAKALAEAAKKAKVERPTPPSNDIRLRHPPGLPGHLFNKSVPICACEWCIYFGELRRWKVANKQPANAATCSKTDTASDARSSLSSDSESDSYFDLSDNSPTPSDSPPTCPLGFEEVVHEIPADPPAPEIPSVVPVTHRPRRMRCDCLLI